MPGYPSHYVEHHSVAGTVRITPHGGGASISVSESRYIAVGPQDSKNVMLGDLSKQALGALIELLRRVHPDLFGPQYPHPDRATHARDDDANDLSEKHHEQQEARFLDAE